MAKKKTETKGRSAVGREQRIALALRALMDALDDHVLDAEVGNNVAKEVMAAQETLDSLGYSDLIGIPRRVTQLNEQLQKAVADGNGKEISRLGIELDRAKEGKPPLKVKAAAKAATTDGGAK